MNGDQLCTLYADFSNFLHQEAQKEIRPLITCYSSGPNGQLTVTTAKELTAAQQDVLKTFSASMVFQQHQAQITPAELSQVPHLAFQ